MMEATGRFPGNIPWRYVRQHVRNTYIGYNLHDLRKQVGSGMALQRYGMVSFKG